MQSLIITFDPKRPGAAQKEVEFHFKELGLDLIFLHSNIPGVFEMLVDDSRDVAKKINLLYEKYPDYFEAVHHYVPIDKWCKTGVKAIHSCIEEIESSIEDDEKWKMQVNKRKSKIKSQELLLKLANLIDKPLVDLKNPDKIVHVQILGKKTGVSVLKKQEFLKVC